MSASPQTPAAEGPPGPGGQIRLFLSASRFHIVLVALLGTLTFSWLLTGSHLWEVALLSALDWWILDVLNKVGDLREDLRNHPAEARWVSRHRRGLLLGCGIALAASLAWSISNVPELTWIRLLFHALGVAYSLNVVWVPPPLRRAGAGAFSRFKVMYGLKNASAEVLFLLSVVGYPLVAAAGEPLLLDALQIAMLCGFFWFLETSFEIIYDFKDIDGDRAEGVRSYPAVHGEAGGRLVFDLCLLLSAAFILTGYFACGLDSRHLVLAFAPAAQAVAFEVFARRGYRSGDTVWITHLCTAELLAYNAYIWADLPWL